MAKVTEARPNALTELVRILRDQLQKKDGKIESLEGALQEASRKIEDRDREVVHLAEKAADAIALASIKYAQSSPSQVVSGAHTATLSPSQAPASPRPVPVAPASKQVVRHATFIQPTASAAVAQQPRIVAQVRAVTASGPSVDEIAERIFAVARSE